MNVSSSQMNAEPVRQRLPQTKPTITFTRLLLMLLAAFVIAAVVFWFVNIRQPGASYQVPVQTEVVNPQTPVAPQAVANPATTAPANQTEKVAADTFPATEKALEKYIVHLATTIGERNLRTYGKLCEAADYIESEFKSYGYQSVRQTYQVHGRDCFNIDVEIKGSKLPDLSLIHI